MPTKKDKDLAETLAIYKAELENMESFIRSEFANPNEHVFGLLLSLETAQLKLRLLRKILLNVKIRR